MKYYIIAGEASGDLHGANLMKALLEVDAKAEFRFWGGDLMYAVNKNLVTHYKARSFMGFTEVIANLKKILGFITHCKDDITHYQPDAIIFIDNSGFNLRIASWAKANHYNTHYYISPQIWASRAGRIKKIKRDIDAMYVILPFEKAFYNTYNYPVNFVGHPLIDAISNRKISDEAAFRHTHKLSKKPIIALLPGSRKQEIKKMLSLMLSIVDDFKDYQFVIAGAPSQEHDFYKSIIQDVDVAFVPNQTYDLLNVAWAALVTSGTATLETALFKVPQVVCYKANAISYQIAKRIITLKFISLVNLIMDREVVTELIQNNFNKKQLTTELQLILQGKTREQQLTDYLALEKKLGGKGASKNTAQLIYKAIR